MSSAILDETVAGVTEILGEELSTIAVERAAIGLFFTGVKLDTGHTGACATPIKTIPEAVCCPSSAMAMPFPGKMRGRPARELVMRTIPSLGNYDYVIDWVLTESGAIRIDVGATGIDAVKAVAAGSMRDPSAAEDTRYGTLVAPQLVEIGRASCRERV